MAKLIKVVDHLSGKTTAEKVAAAEKAAVKPRPLPNPKAQAPKKKKSVEKSVSDSFWNN